MSVISRKRILAEIERGTIIVEPFNIKNLANTSYDVRLGEWYFAQHHLDRNEVFNQFHENSVRKLYGEVQSALPVLQYRSLDNPFYGLDDSDRIIILDPGETILAHTIEFIGGRNRPDLGVAFTTEMRARSSLGRIGIGVCKCAGWGDIGYVNRWTMEITNFSIAPIPLPVGMRVAQIIFHETEPIDAAEQYSALSGKYQTAEAIAELRTQWSPDDMLPKLWKDPDLGAFATYNQG